MVLALVMLMLLTILGTFALNTSSTEMFIAANYRNMQQALYAADAAFEFAFKGANIYSDPKLEGASWPLMNSGTSTDKQFNIVNIEGKPVEVKVEFIKRGGGFPSGLPGYAPSDDNDFEPVFYLIQTKGIGINNALVEVESLTFRVVRKTS
jgi:hypothetical protein